MRILVGGVGNVFLGDDGFGVEVVARLRSVSLPLGVDVVDFGIRGIDLAYALEEYDAAILVDTVCRGGAPGTLYVLEPEADVGGGGVHPHSMTPDRVLAWMHPGMGPRTIRIVGCEPASFGPEGVGQLGLSEPVLAAADEAVGLVCSLIIEMTATEVAHA
jgi:hydrogenase maturation protease